MAIADCSHSHLCLREVSNFSTQRQGIGLWTWKNPCRNKDIPSALDNSPIVATAMAEPHLLRLSNLLSVSIWFVLDHFACNRSTISLRRYSSILHVRTLILVTSPLSLTRLLEAASCFQYMACNSSTNSASQFHIRPFCTAKREHRLTIQPRWR